MAFRYYAARIEPHALEKMPVTRVQRKAPFRETFFHGKTPRTYSRVARAENISVDAPTSRAAQISAQKSASRRQIAAINFARTRAYVSSHLPKKHFEK